MKKVEEFKVLTQICPMQIEGKIGGAYFHLRLRDFRLWVGFYPDEELTDCIYSYKWNVWEEHMMDVTKALGIVEYTHAMMERYYLGEEE